MTATEHTTTNWKRYWKGVDTILRLHAPSFAGDSKDIRREWTSCGISLRTIRRRLLDHGEPSIRQLASIKLFFERRGGEAEATYQSLANAYVRLPTVGKHPAQERKPDKWRFVR